MRSPSLVFDDSQSDLGVSVCGVKDVFVTLLEDKEVGEGKEKDVGSDLLN